MQRYKESKHRAQNRVLSKDALGSCMNQLAFAFCKLSMKKMAYMIIGFHFFPKLVPIDRWWSLSQGLEPWSWRLIWCSCVWWGQGDSMFRNLLLLKHSGHLKTVLSFSCRVNPHLLATRRPDSETWDVLGILLMLRAGERLLFSSPFIN